jgi:excisionase family DNA binding protein
MEPLLGVREVGRVLGVKQATVYRLLHSGELPFVQLGRRRLLVEPEALREFVVARRRGSLEKSRDPAETPGLEESVDARDDGRDTG